MKKYIASVACLIIGAVLGFFVGRIGYVPEVPVETHVWEYWGTVVDIEIEDSKNRTITVELHKNTTLSDEGIIKTFRILPDTRDAGTVPYKDLTVGDTIYLLVEFYEQDPEVICTVFGASEWTIPK